MQTQLQAISSRTKLPEVHGNSKGLDSNIQTEKQVMKSSVSKTNKILHIKPRIGQGRAGIKLKRSQLSQRITQSIENSQKNPEVPK